MVTAEKQIERNPNFVFRRIVDEAVLVPIHQDVANMDCIYTLNDVAAFVWEHLAKPMPKALIRQVMLEEYETDDITLTNDLDRFLAEMVSIGALREV